MPRASKRSSESGAPRQSVADARCRVEMLGALRLVRDDLPAPVTRFALKKAGALLAYLALNPAPQPRERLIDLFWPEMEPSAARANLSTTLASLRRQLEPSGVGRGQVILADQTHIGLNPAAVTTDVADFDRLLDRAQAEVSLAARADLLQEVIDLYQGDLLPGYYEDWSLSEMMRLQGRYTHVLARLSADHEALGDLTAALETARRLVATDAYSEEAHLRQIRLLVRTGHLKEAKEASRKVEVLFEEEYGAPLAPATRRAIEELLSRPPDEPALRQVAAPNSALSRSLPEPKAPGGEPADSLLAGRPETGSRSLPVTLSRFFGRKPEMEQLAGLLLPRKGIPDGPELPNRPDRLVTLVGPGGNGKTRVALEFLHQVAEPLGIWCGFVSLADLTSPSEFPDRIASALKISVATQEDASPLDPIARFLAERDGRTTPSAILALDNLEHLLIQDGTSPYSGSGSEIGDVVRSVEYLLSMAPGLSILCTSRQRLGLRGERLIPLGPLPVPELKDEGGRMKDERTGISSSFILHPSSFMLVPSVQLYVDRAQSARPDFSLTATNAPAVAALCRLLDGSPLALELAAAWVRMLPPRKMLERLSQGLEIPQGAYSNLPARHRSLNAAIEWSYRLLTPAAQRLFARLAVFQGGWTAASAAAVAGNGDEFQMLILLSALHEASLIEVSAANRKFGTNDENDEGEVRYHFLETVRLFARQRLEERGERPHVQRRCAQHFLEFAEDAEPELYRPDQAIWLERLEAEHDNLRTGLDCLLAGNREEDIVEAMRLASAMMRFWQVRGHWREARRRLDEVLARAEGFTTPTALRARILNGVGGFANMQGDYAQSRRLWEAALALRRELGDRARIADSLHNLGMAALQQREGHLARARYEEALAIFRELGDPRGIADEMHHLGWLAETQGDYAQASQFYEESLATRRPLGDLRGIAYTLQNLAAIALREERLDRSRALQEEALTIRRELDDRKGLAASYVGLGNLLLQTADYGPAREMYLQSLAINEEMVSLPELLDGLYNLVVIEFMQQQLPRAVQLYAATEAQCTARKYGRPGGIENIRRMIDSASENLGRAATERALAAGQRMTWQEAVAFARSS